MELMNLIDLAPFHITEAMIPKEIYKVKYMISAVRAHEEKGTIEKI